jgi:hypothetical protein
VWARKSSKHNVAKVKDVEAALLSVEEVQPYLINNEMVLFLNARPQIGKGKPGVYRCDRAPRRGLPLLLPPMQGINRYAL